MLNRTLKIDTADGERDVQIKFFQPIEHREHEWECKYEIGWPDRVKKSQAFGVDSVQSLLLAMQKVAADIYTSEAHRSGKLAWLERGRGYGFHLPRTVRDLYEGDDRSL